MSRIPVASFVMLAAVALMPAPASRAAAPEALAAIAARAESLLRRGDAAGAAALLQPMAGEDWPASDVALLLLASARLREGRAEDALAHVVAARRARPRGPHDLEAAWLEADAMAALGRTEAAPAYEALAGMGDDAARRGLALVRAAQAHEARGDLARASSAWRRAALEAPAQAPDDALERSAGLARRAGLAAVPMSPSELVRHAKALRGAQLHARAAATLRSAEPKLSGAALVEAMTLRARSLYDLRENDEARDACSEVLRRAPGTDDAATCRLVSARAAWRSGDLDAVLRHSEAGLSDARLRSAPERPELRLVHAGALADAGRLEDSAADLLAVIGETPARAGDARFRLAWTRMKQGRPAEAAAQFALLAREQRGTELERVGALSQALARERAGEDATDAFAEIVRTWPWTRQAEQAREVLSTRWSADLLAQLEAEAEATGVVARMPPPLRLAEPGRTRHRLLRDAGLNAWARRELEALRPAGPLDDAFALELARARARAGSASAAESLVAAHFSSALRAPSRRSPRSFWEVVYPMPHAEVVEEEAARQGVDPALAAAIIRTESAWDPAARSWADARGLMQVVPATAAPLARRLGLAAYVPDDLFDPSVNVAIGTRHLAELVALFSGDLDAAIAAYNAGEHVVARWWADFDREGVPAIERAERIPYRETRQYVRRVREAMGWYRWLLACDPEQG